MTAPGEGERADLPGLDNRFLMRGGETEGRFALTEHTIPSRTLAAPMHVHRNEAGPGELVRKPRGIPHAFWNSGDEETGLLELISPVGVEQYFADLAPLLAAEEEPGFAALAAIQARYSLEMDFESIGRLTAEHGLGR